MGILGVEDGDLQLNINRMYPPIGNLAVFCSSVVNMPILDGWYWQAVPES